MKSGLHLGQTTPVVLAKNPPLGAREFAALMETFVPFASPLHVAVAVSGGPDSMALVFCVKRWLDEKTEVGSITAFIVDHDLRDASAAEAEQVRKTLMKIGIPAEILRWQHAPVTARLHETARTARRRLLTEACRRRAIPDLLLAHHSDDQAETILMRLAKGSGVDGLAGMRAKNASGGVRILRPLLGLARERLAATCVAAKLPFVSDPTNVSQKFARGRLRRVLPLLAAEGLTIERLVDLGARAADVKAALDFAVAALLRVATKFDDAAVIRIDLEHLRSAPHAIAERALGMCLQTIHRQDYPPAHAALTRLRAALCADDEASACTLQGCLIGKNRAHALIMREYSAIEDMPTIRPGESVMWDQRWHVTLAAGAQDSLTIHPLGNPPHEVLDRLAPGLRKQIPQGRVRAGLPALWLNGALALIPALPRSAYSAVAQAAPAASWPPVPG